MRSGFIRINAKIAIQGLALLASIIITAVILVQQSSAQTANSSMNKSPEGTGFQMRDRLHLTEDQRKQINPIIQQKLQQKRIEYFDRRIKMTARQSTLQQVPSRDTHIKRA